MSRRAPSVTHSATSHPHPTPHHPRSPHHHDEAAASLTRGAIGCRSSRNALEITLDFPEHAHVTIRTDKMHFIIFEGTSEESTHPTAGLDLCGDRDLEAVSTGDTVWVITRLGGDRPAPGLCGRLRAAGVTPHISGEGGFDRSHADCGYRLLVDEDHSERCVPFSCDMILSWNIWRQPFRGVRELTEEQGRTLNIEWAKSARETR